MTIDYYTRKPTIKFPLNNYKFNVLMEVLTQVEMNSEKEEESEKAHDIKDNILRYSYNQRVGDYVAIIDIGLYPNEADSLIVMLLELNEKQVIPKDDYTKYLKRH